MKIDWVEWIGRGMQLALVVLVVFGFYGWAQRESAKQDAMCDVALSYVEVLEAQRGATRQEIRNAQKVADDACAQPESNDY
jgi:predicted negative regulator of RcsB-dependent stress response